MKLPNILSKKEVETIIYHAPSFRAKIAMLLMAYCGLRISEVSKLRASHINLKEHYLKVVSGKRGKDRYVPLPNKVIHDLKVWIDLMKDELFPISKETLWRDFKIACKKAHIQAHPHQFRHFYATEILLKTNNLRAVQELLGHSDIRATQIYTHLTPEIKRSIVKEVFDVGRGK